MDEESRQHLKSLLHTYRRRLRVLEQQAALSGPRTPPETSIEIDDLRTDIARVEGLLNTRLTSLPYALPPEKIKTTVKTPFGRYQIKQELGRGGMSIVYIAYDPLVGRDVALKSLAPSLLQDPNFKIRFEREVRIAAQLEHAAIVPIYDYSGHNARPYIVMRLMKGGTLADKLVQGRLSFSEIDLIVQRICSALDAAHAHNIVHCDLKPGNILFDEYGIAYLADFGIARLDQDIHTAINFGSPQYMTPEQALGQNLDTRTDIYQMGVVLFEMLTGRVPFDADNPASFLYHHVNTLVPSIQKINPSLPLAYQKIVTRAMEKNKEDRFTTANELATALSAIVKGVGMSTFKASSRQQQPTLQANRIATTTQSITQLILQQTKSMNNRQLIILTVTLVSSLIIMTILLGDFIQMNIPFLWEFFSSFYFIAAPLAYIFSRRKSSPILVHIPTHIAVNIILLNVLMNTISFISIVIGGIASGIVLWFMLNQSTIPARIRYPLSVTSAYTIMMLVTYLTPSMGHPAYYSIIGATIIGFVSYMISEMYKGVQQARFVNEL